MDLRRHEYPAHCTGRGSRHITACPTKPGLESAVRDMGIGRRGELPLIFGSSAKSMAA
jgi:hypothetical protein